MRPFRKFINYSLLFLGILILLEGILRLFGLFKTYSESLSGEYTSYYNMRSPSWYWTWEPNDTWCYQQPEFEFTYNTNTLGLREKELDHFRTTDDTSIILFLGDSFTEGDGVEYEFSMPRFFEKNLNRHSKKKYKVFNAGRCGSDPWFCYTLFRDKFQPLNPEVVFLLVNESDINDIVFRGGYSRFQSDSTTLFREGPAYEKWFKHFYLIRFYTVLFRDGESLLSKKQAKKMRQMAVNEVILSITRLDSLCRSRNAKLIVAIHPFPNSFSIPLNLDSGFEDDILKTGDGLSILEPKVDYINLYPAFKEVFRKEDYSHYSWNINGHFNSRGYELFATLLYDEIMKDSLYTF